MICLTEHTCLNKFVRQCHTRDLYRLDSDACKLIQWHVRNQSPLPVNLFNKPNEMSNEYVAQTNSSNLTTKRTAKKSVSFSDLFNHSILFKCSTHWIPFSYAFYAFLLKSAFYVCVFSLLLFVVNFSCNFFIRYSCSCCLFRISYFLNINGGR